MQDWTQTITAVIGFVVSGGGAVLYIERRIRSVETNLSDFKEHLPKYLNGTYRRAKEAELIEGEFRRRIDHLEDRL